MRPEHLPPPADAWPEPRGIEIVGPHLPLADALEPLGWAWDPETLSWRWRDET